MNNPNVQFVCCVCKKSEVTTGITCCENYFCGKDCENKYERGRFEGIISNYPIDKQIKLREAHREGILARFGDYTTRISIITGKKVEVPPPMYRIPAITPR